MLPYRPLPTWFVFTVGFVLTATVFISAAYAGPLVLAFLAPIGCVCTSWALFFATRRFLPLHLIAALIDTAVVAQWLWRRRDPMYDISQTWYAMVILWCLIFAQLGVFLYSSRERI